MSRRPYVPTNVIMRGALGTAQIQLEQIVAGAKGEDPEAEAALAEVNEAIAVYDRARKLERIIHGGN